MSKVKVEGGQSLNDEIGSEWENHEAGYNVGSDNAGPNASVEAYAATKSTAVKAGASAGAHVFKFKKDSVEIKTFGVEVGARVEAGAGGIGAGVEAKATLVEAEGGGCGVKLGLGVSTGAEIGPGGVSAKVAGVGFSLGKKVGISVFDNEIYIDIPKLGKLLSLW